MPLHYHDFITPKSSGNAAIGKAVALGFLFLLVALGDGCIDERYARLGDREEGESDSGAGEILVKL